MMATRPNTPQTRNDHSLLQATNALSTPTITSNDFSYLEGPWPEMSPYLIADITTHLASGGDEDFAYSKWGRSRSLTQAGSGKRTHYELFGFPHKVLPAGRFQYKRNRQIVVVGLPLADSEEPRCVIVFHKKEVIWSPNNHLGCYGYRWWIWMPQSLRGPSYSRQKSQILRIYHTQPEAARTEEAKHTIDEREEPPAKKLRITLKMGSKKSIPSPSDSPESFLQEILHTIASDNVTQGPSEVSSVPHASFRDTPSALTEVAEDEANVELAFATPSVYPETTAILSNQGSVAEEAETITVVLVPNTSTEHISIDESDFSTVQSTVDQIVDVPAVVSEAHRNEIAQEDPDEITAAMQESVIPQAHHRTPDLMDDNTNSGSIVDSSPVSVESPARAQKIKKEAVIVIDDDDAPEVKKEATNIEQTYNSWTVAVPQPSYHLSIANSHDIGQFNDSEATQSLYPPSRHHVEYVPTFEAPYRNVQVQFQDTNGTVRDEKPFRRCASARDLFEAAIEADIIERHTRMFIVQVSAGKETRMRFEEEESFREKFSEPLNRILSHEAGAKVTVRVRGLVYVRP